MPIFTLKEIAEQKADYKAALKACAVNQEHVIGRRRYTRADLPEIRVTLEWLDREERMLKGTGGPQIVTGVPSR